MDKNVEALKEICKGVKYPEDCKFTVAVNEIIITDVIEIIPCTEEAIKNLESVKIWKI